MSLALAGVAVAGSILGSSAKDNAWKTESRKAGRNRAQVETSRSRALSMLEAKAADVELAAQAKSIQIKSEETAALSEAAVAAAAAGAAGANVDQTAQDIEGNAARVQATLEKSRRAGLLQVNQDYEDIWLEGEAQKYKVDVTGGSSGVRNLASAALAGLGAYYGS